MFALFLTEHIIFFYLLHLITPRHDLTVGLILQILLYDSPSKEFAKLGNFSGLGFGEGFTNSLDKVYKKMKSAVDFETQKLNSNLTTNAVIKVQRNSDIQSTLTSIDNNREIQVNSTLELDGKVVANTVNKVNAKQKLQYGIA